MVKSLHTQNRTGTRADSSYLLGSTFGRTSVDFGLVLTLGILVGIYTGLWAVLGIGFAMCAAWHGIRFVRETAAQRRIDPAPAPTLARRAQVAHPHLHRAA
ncbi:hypothetical protein [Rhodococcus sp. HNM0569]|uniref:hypothetical protein n=1 Tax=Rhodococcus sp. HNM0569 TaxID=2716340 RepID=UPI00146F6AC9|nr:hypothetical protein [Rhodococcus sp. HNM0569]NLU84778.1 hypothetical protein [Rhodococcus sp. HNM0569]